MKTYRLDEVADHFKVSRRTVERWVKNGELESVRIGHTRRISETALEKKFDNNTTNADNPNVKHT